MSAATLHRMTRAAAFSILMALLPAASASASDSTCSQDPATATTTVTVGPGGAFAGTVFVNRDGGLAIDDADMNPPAPPCGTTSNTDLVAITGTLDEGDDLFYIGDNTANRPFAPGLTDEPGGSDEIEFIATVTGGTLGIDHRLIGVGSVNSTSTALGKNDINMNAGESDGVDADVTVSGPESVYVVGDSAHDVIDGSGGSGTPNQPFALPLMAEGHEGGDELIGGMDRDTLYGSEDRDKLFGEDGDDRRLSGGDDDDKVNGGDGKDRLFGDEGDDVLKGGSGRDICDGGPGNDVFRQCEVERD